MDAKIKELAQEYWNGFSETAVDGEWSTTAYEDLGSLKSEMDWSEFHFALETAVKEIDAELGVEED
jgi:hypothetical protein